MLERKDVLDMAFYEKLPFKGSLGELRYKIEKKESEEEGKRLVVTLWPGPLCFEATDESLMESHYEDFSEEGMEKIVEYINSKCSDYQ